MNNISRILPLFAVITLLTSCSGTQYTSAYDDVYYSPKDDLIANNDTYVDIDDRADVDGSDDYRKGREVEEYYDPDAKAGKYDPSLDYDDYRERYNQNEYYYSSRFRRFHQPYYSFGYYDPFYSNANWYSYDRYFWSPRVVRPYYYSPGWGFNWNNQFGWTASYTNGWFNSYPFAGYNGNFGGYGFSPYAYYGNSFCPPYGAPGFAGNDFYYNSTPVYRGQYNSLGSYSSSSSTQLGKMLPASKPMYEIQETGRPADLTRPGSTSRPYERPDHDYARPSEESRPASTRPSQLERPREEVRPREDYRPRETRPATPRTRPIDRPRQNRTFDSPRNNRGSGSVSPSRSTSPSRSRDTGSGTGGRRK